MLTNLRHRVSFMKPTVSYFGGGCGTETLQTVSTEWANVQKINMINDVKNYKDQQFNFYKITVRNNPISTDEIVIDNSLIVYWNNKSLKINSVADGSNRNHMLRLDCQEEVGNNA